MLDNPTVSSGEPAVPGSGRSGPGNVGRQGEGGTESRRASGGGRQRPAPQSAPARVACPATTEWSGIRVLSRDVGDRVCGRRILRRAQQWGDRRQARASTAAAPVGGTECYLTPGHQTRAAPDTIGGIDSGAPSPSERWTVEGGLERTGRSRPAVRQRQVPVAATGAPGSATGAPGSAMAVVDVSPTSGANGGRTTSDQPRAGLSGRGSAGTGWSVEAGSALRETVGTATSAERSVRHGTTGRVTRPLVSRAVVIGAVRTGIPESTEGNRRGKARIGHRRVRKGVRDGIVCNRRRRGLRRRERRIRRGTVGAERMPGTDQTLHDSGGRCATRSKCQFAPR